MVFDHFLYFALEEAHHEREFGLEIEHAVFDLQSTGEVLLLGGERKGQHIVVPTLLDIGEQMTGKTICVLSDSCAVPVISGIKKFRGEFEALIQGRRFHPVTAAVA